MRGLEDALDKTQDTFSKSFNNIEGLLSAMRQ